ncbi:MAG: epimerase, partial [Panacibacter sp.]
MENIETVYKKMLQPSDDLVTDIARLEGDIIILGVGGKMGPALARVAKKAVDRAGVKKGIIGVARFSEAGLQQSLQNEGIETIKADLLNEEALQALPEVKNVIYMAGVKFGTIG